MNILVKCARAFYNLTNQAKTADEVDEFYQGLKYPAMLTQKLREHGFVYQGELRWLDWNKTPAESLGSKSKKLNCGDYLELYLELYRRLNVSYDVYLLEPNDNWLWKQKWHFVSVITWQKKRLMQSNNVLSYIDIDNDDAILAAFKGEFSKITKL